MKVLLRRLLFFVICRCVSNFVKEYRENGVRVIGSRGVRMCLCVFVGFKIEEVIMFVC